jgi:hypothetical protein
VTIFDSLKYPIPDEPTTADIESISPQIAGYWMISSPWLFFRLCLHGTKISKLKFFTVTRDEIRDSLRKAIFNYGEPFSQAIKRWFQK